MDCPHFSEVYEDLPGIIENRVTFREMLLDPTSELGENARVDRALYAIESVANSGDQAEAMSMTATKEELEFLHSFDAQFSYEDEVAWKALIRQGTRHSDNIKYAILEEICNPPRSATVSPETQLEMIRYWQSQHSPVMCDEMIRTAVLKIQRKTLTRSKTIDLLQRLSEHPGQYCAMNIVLFSAEEEAWETVEMLRDQIADKWREEYPSL